MGWYPMTSRNSTNTGLFWTAVAHNSPLLNDEGGPPVAPGLHHQLAHVGIDL
jgi:hypothetical protein